MIEGKLYKCPDYCLLIYPTKEMAATAPTAAAVVATRDDATLWANYWSKGLNRSVRFAEPNEMFMCLSEPKDEFAHVLFGEKRGWIISEPWLKIEEVPTKVSQNI